MTGKSVLIFSIAFLFVLLMGWLGQQRVAPWEILVGPRSADQVRIACVGDSITFGSGIRNPKRNSYPAQLGQRLGQGYRVRNFGVGGTTLLKQGDFPYWQQKAYQQTLAFNPDIVVIKLGTNDSKPQNWRYGDAFLETYEALVEQFQTLDSQPQVWVCTPVPAYSQLAGIEAAVIVKEVIPQVKQVAELTGAGLIDLYGALSDRPELFPDGVHPNTEGAALIAETVFRTIAPQPET